MRSTRQRSSDQSKSEESYDEAETPIEAEVIDGTVEEAEVEKEEAKGGLNANAADFVTTFTPKGLQSSQPEEQQQQPQISFIAAMPSPNPPSSAPAPQRQGIYGDTTSNSPKLGQSARIEEASSNSPINVDESAPFVKKMELSRKAWDNAPSGRQPNNTTPNKDEPKSAAPVANQQSSTSMPSQEPFEPSQPINAESNWQQPSEQWSNGKSSQNISDAWSSNNNKQQDNWKKNEPMVQTPVSFRGCFFKVFL